MLLSLPRTCGMALAMSLGLVFACQQTDTTSGPTPEPTKAPPTDFAFDTSKRVDLPASAPTRAGKDAQATPARPTLSKSDLAEIRKLLPKLEHTRVLTELSVTPHSRLARMVLCVYKPVAESTSLVLKGYRDTGWTAVTANTPPHHDNRRSFTGNSVRWRVNGSTSQGAFEECDKAEGRSRIALSFQERQPPKSPMAKPNKAISPGAVSPTKTPKPKRLTPQLKLNTSVNAAKAKAGE